VSGPGAAAVAYSAAGGRKEGVAASGGSWAGASAGAGAGVGAWGELVPVVSVTEWSSREALEAAAASEGYRDAMRALGEFFAGRAPEASAFVQRAAHDARWPAALAASSEGAGGAAGEDAGGGGATPL
jgi:hypothetical protein